MQQAERVVSSHQPGAMSHPAYWTKLALSHVHVMLGYPRPGKDDYAHRIRSYGQVLTIPLDRSTVDLPFHQVRFKPDAKRKFVESVRQRYASGAVPHDRAKRVGSVLSVLMESYDAGVLRTNLNMISAVLSILNLSRPTVWVDVEPETLTAGPLERLQARLHGRGLTPCCYLMGRGASEGYYDPARADLSIDYVECTSSSPYDNLFALLAGEDDPTQHLLDHAILRTLGAYKCQ